MVTPAEIAFVTSNRGKFVEVRSTLRPYGVRVRWSRRELPELQADALDEVVRGKLAAAGTGRTPVLVEDSGLFLDGLGGFPGVYSSYAYRTIGLRGILALLRGRPRGATFRTVAGLRLPDGVVMALGETVGTIARAARGSGGFGYDPIFLPKGERRTFAEMSLEEKNALSHRGRAIRALAEQLARHR
ncbi:MAG TPA: non-canonical purine NTP pyrophosphatase [Thermoplasmata archaeon]|nr:non-canonical purine NTP pyrophosphatase [Thermoplasmata archaeon]